MRFFLNKLTTVALFSLTFAQGCLSDITASRDTAHYRKPIDILYALHALSDYCYELAPTFEGVQSKALSKKYKLQSDGWLESPNSGLTLIVQEYPEFRNCQIAFASKQTIAEFDKYMKHPFNATQISELDAVKLFGSKFDRWRYTLSVKRLYASKTTFEREVPAVLYGFVFRDPSAKKGVNSFGFILQVDR